MGDESWIKERTRNGRLWQSNLQARNTLSAATKDASLGSLHFGIVVAVSEHGLHLKLSNVEIKTEKSTVFRVRKQRLLALSERDARRALDARRIGTPSVTKHLILTKDSKRARQSSSSKKIDGGVKTT